MSIYQWWRAGVWWRGTAWHQTHKGQMRTGQPTLLLMLLHHPRHTRNQNERTPVDSGLGHASSLDARYSWFSLDAVGRISSFFITTIGLVSQINWLLQLSRWFNSLLGTTGFSLDAIDNSNSLFMIEVTGSVSHRRCWCSYDVWPNLFVMPILLFFWGLGGGGG